MRPDQTSAEARISAKPPQSLRNKNETTQTTGAQNFPASLGRGRQPVLQENLLDVLNAAVGGEDEANVASDLSSEQVQASIWVLLVAHP